MKRQKLSIQQFALERFYCSKLGKKNHFYPKKLFWKISIYSCQRLGSNQTTQSRTKDAQRLFKRTKDTHKRNNSKSTFCFLPAKSSKEALMKS